MIVIIGIYSDVWGGGGGGGGGNWCRGQDRDHMVVGCQVLKTTSLT